MSLVKLRAKVMLQAEDQMETEGTYDLGNIAQSKEWVWRRIALPVEEIYRVIEYSKSKSIVEINGGERILVSEAFDEVYVKWYDARKEVDITTEETSEEEKDEENSDKDDDDE